jgi:hypothetical protein
MSARHAQQRANRRELKADAVVLLDRIMARYPDVLWAATKVEIAEMRMRLAPPPGIKAPVIRTGYTRKKR